MYPRVASSSSVYRRWGLLRGLPAPVSATHVRQPVGRSRIAPSEPRDEGQDLFPLLLANRHLQGVSNLLRGEPSFAECANPRDGFGRRTEGTGAPRVRFPKRSPRRRLRRTGVAELSACATSMPFLAQIVLINSRSLRATSPFKTGLRYFGIKARGFDDPIRVRPVAGWSRSSSSSGSPGHCLRGCD
jgi:hypothetical protein